MSNATPVDNLETLSFEPTKSFTTNLIESLTGRVLSMAILIIAGEMFWNLLGSQSHYLNPFWSWFFMGLVLASEFGMFYASWFTEYGKVAFAIFAGVVLLAICTWGLQLHGANHVVVSETPWVYEALGVAGIASALAFPPAVSAAYQVLIPMAWVILRESTTVSQFQQWDSVLGAVYVFLFSISVSALVWLLKSSAQKTDFASQKAAEAAAESARIDAIERERYRIDAIVHDKVLTTLILASSVKTQVEAKNVKALADEAIEKLISFSSLQVTDQSPITIQSFFEALRTSARAIDPAIEVDMGKTADLEVDSDVAAAISEAMIQALTNSVQHAGRGVKRELVLRNHTEGIKVVVIDNGKGFRESKVPKHRLGIQLSIRRRMADVGGKVSIKSQPSQGCTVILQWVKK